MHFGKISVALTALLTVTATGCKKKGTGGGGGWLVGDDGLMANVDEEGKLGPGYDLGASESLNGIACRYLDEAWVVGSHGTLLYTSDAGARWAAQGVGTTADLHALATQNAGPVFLAGDGVFLTSTPDDETGAATWRSLGDGTTRFRSLAAAQEGETVLAVADDGGLWSFEADRLVRRTSIEGARAVAVSPDGQSVLVAGQGLARSHDGGHTWQTLAAGMSFAAARIDNEGEALAVGAAGLVARIDAEGRVLAQHVGTVDLTTLHLNPDWDDLGFAGAADGQVYISRDVGWSWTAGPNLGRTILGADQIGDGHN